ncbi:MAG: helix-turn-helix domain-containing protein [Desulfobacteraceae bacterium]|nr:helix-turn-helix domain-containing protein [Desulfobacteraceae bacterium]
MIYVSFLAKEDYEELKMMKRKEIGRVSLRAQMVLLSAKHWAVPRIADLFEISPATVRFWLRKFEKEGPKGLYDENRSGRPSKEVHEKEPTLVEGS